MIVLLPPCIIKNFYSGTEESFNYLCSILITIIIFYIVNTIFKSNTYDISNKSNEFIIDKKKINLVFIFVFIIILIYFYYNKSPLINTFTINELTGLDKRFINDGNNPILALFYELIRRVIIPIFFVKLKNRYYD